MLVVGATWFLDLFSAIIPPLDGGLSGGIAATYITIVGKTYTTVFEKLAEQNLNGATKTEIEDFIKNTFREEFNKNSKIRIGSKRDLDRLDIL